MIRRLWPLLLVLTVIIGLAAPAFAQVMELLGLPSQAYLFDGTQEGNASLLMVSEQSVTVAPGDNVSLTMTFTVPGVGFSRPGQRDLVFLIFSWTPSWPPTREYFIQLLDQDPTQRGLTRTETVYFTAPEDAGQYFIWFCTGAQLDQLSVQDAVNRFTGSLPLPAHLMVNVNVSNRVAFLAPDCIGGKNEVDSLSQTADSDNLKVVGTQFYTPYTVGYTNVVNKLLQTKPGIVWVVCTKEDKPRIEQELIDAKYEDETRWEEGAYHALSNENGITFDPEPPVKRGDTILITVSPTNNGWMTLNSTAAEFKITRTDGSPVFSIVRTGKSLEPGASDDFEISWSVPRQLEGNSYYVDVVTTGYEGQDKSSRKIELSNSRTLEVEGMSTPNILLPIIIAVIVVLLIAIIAVTRRRKSTIPRHRV